MKKTGAAERKKGKDLGTRFRTMMRRKSWLLITVLAMAILLSIGTAQADTASSRQPVIAAGQRHTVVLKSDGTLWAWGFNFWGQLGDGTTVNTSSPIQIGTDSNWVSVAAGGLNTVGLK